MENKQSYKERLLNQIAESHLKLADGRDISAEHKKIAKAMQLLALEF